jgi:UDP-glucuronate 4-epimerase
MDDRLKRLRVGHSILVTGGAGFIGSHLVESLLDGGETVVVLDDFESRVSGASEHWEHLRNVVRHPRLRISIGDIRDRFAVDHAIQSNDVGRVVHLAARAGVQPSLQDPALYADVNVTGTANVLDSCARHGVTHVVAASSSSVYGAGAEVPFREAAVADRPLSPYAVTKRANELQCWTYHHLTGRSVTCLRFFTAYGPRNRPDMGVYRFAESIRSGEEILVHGTQTQRDFTFVMDIVDGVLSALQRPRGMLVCNLGHGSPVAVSDVIGTLARLLGREPVLRNVPLPPGDVPITWADCSVARDVLDWRPRTGLDAGLATFVKWYLDRDHTYSRSRERELSGTHAGSRM